MEGTEAYYVGAGTLNRGAGRRQWNGRAVDDALLAARCAGYWLGLPDRAATAHPFPESEAAGILAWLLSVRRRWLERPHTDDWRKVQAKRGRTSGQARASAIRERDHELARLHALGVCAAEKSDHNMKWIMMFITTTGSGRSCRKSSHGADS